MTLPLNGVPVAGSLMTMGVGSVSNSPKLPVNMGRAGDAIGILQALPKAKSLIVRYEKQLLAPVKQMRYAHWPTQLESIIVPFEWVFRVHCCELILLGVQNIVAEKFKQSSVIGICARLGQDVDLCAFVSILRRIDADLDFKLLNRINRRKRDVGVEVRVGVIDAVEGVVIEHDSLPAGGDCLRGAITALAGARLSGCG